MGFGKILLAILASAAEISALGTSTHSTSSAATPTILHQFPSGFLPENLLKRKNGQLVVTINSPPSVYQVDPAGVGPARLIYNFTQFTGAGGIVELQQDIFGVVVGNASAQPFSGTPKTWALWQIDLRYYQPPAYDASKIVVQKIVPVPEALDLDGIAFVNQSRGLIAAADFVAGNLRLIDVPSKRSSILAESPLLQGQNGTTTLFGPIGANGLKVENSSVYFTTTTKGIYGRVKVDTLTGKAVGPVETVFNFTSSFSLDDFNFAKNGNAYITTLITPNGGILRRPAGTPIGVNGTTLVVSSFGANAVILNGSTRACTLYICNAIEGQIQKATLPQPC